MKITKLGKILVFINLAMSVAFAALALGVYTNRIDWVGGGKTPAGDDIQGEATKIQKKVQQEQEAAPIARARWETARATYLAVEDLRPKAKDWYANELKIMDSGGPIKELDYAEGKLKVDNATGLPIFKAPGRPLQPVDQLKQEAKNLEKKIADEQTEIDKLIAQEKQLTIKLNGNEGKKDGLRHLLAEEKQAQEKSLAEFDYLKPLRINRQVEGDLLMKRQASLEARIQELKKTGVATKQP